MARKHARDDLLPVPDIEYLLAHRLLANKNPLPKAIVLELLGRPCGYGELRWTLRVRSDNQLTRALQYLTEEGIIMRRLDLSRRPPAPSYELGPLGRLVLMRMLQMTPVEAAAEMLLRGRAAERRARAEA